MIPILFTAEAEPDALIDVNSIPLHDVDDIELLAAGDRTIARLFDTYGLGALTDSISCEVEEERNGEYVLTMEYPVSGVHYGEIELRCIILAKPNYSDSLQAFRIYSMTTPIDGIVRIDARHLSYDLSGVPVLPFTATSCADACQGLIDNAAIDTLFSVGTQIGTIADFKADVPASVRSWFGGKEGSLIDVYGGEWAYDNYTCTLKASRGADRGVTIRYGVNLIDFEQEKNCESTYTGVLPYWADEEGNQVRANIINLAGSFDYRRIMCLDLSTDFEEQPTAQQLTDRANSYITANNIGIPKVSITLDWVQALELSDRVELCDTVKVVFEKIGVETSAKVVRVVWDVLKERYSEIEIGEPKSTITDTLASLAQEAEKATSSVSTVMLGAIARATAAITGNTGGYVVMHDSDGDGEPDEILIMNTPDISTATKIWRWNQAGLGYSNSGYNGTFGLAMTADGEIVADYITTGTLNSIRINNGNGTLTISPNGTLTSYDPTDSTTYLGLDSGSIFSYRAGNYCGKISDAWSDSSSYGLGIYGDYLVYLRSNHGYVWANADTCFRADAGTYIYMGAGTYIYMGAGTYWEAKAETYARITAATSLYLNATANNVMVGTGTNYGLIPSADNNSNLGAVNYRWKTVYAVTGTIQTSDRNKKKFIKALADENKWDKLFDGLVPSRFMLKADGGTEHDRFHVGYIAQDIEDTMTEIGMDPTEFGGFCKDGDNYALRYAEFIALNTEQIQKAKARIDTLEQTVQNQKHELDELKATVTDLTARLDRLEARFSDDGR